MKTYIPIAVFAYNRPIHLKKCLDALKAAKLASESELFIFSDGPKKIGDEESIKEVRKVIDETNGFKNISVRKSNKNIGLANSIIGGVSKIFNEYEELIVLEDDLIVSNDFLEYMNNALNFYKQNEKVFSVSGYCAPVKIKNYAKDIFFYQRINSWGWGTWKNRWNSVDWDLKDFDSFIQDKENRKLLNQGGKDLTMMLLKYKMGLVDSWAIRFNYACFKQRKLNLYPSKSKIINLGVDDSGTHTKKSNKFATKIDSSPVIFSDSIVEKEEIRNAYSSFLNPSLFRQVINEIKTWKYLRQKMEK